MRSQIPGTCRSELVARDKTWGRPSQIRSFSEEGAVSVASSGLVPFVCHFFGGGTLFWGRPF